MKWWWWYEEEVVGSSTLIWFQIETRRCVACCRENVE